VQIGSLKPAES